MSMTEEDLMRMNRVLRHRLRNFASGMKAAVNVLSHELRGRLSPAQGEYFPLIIKECDALAGVAARLTLFFEGVAPGQRGQVGAVMADLKKIMREQFPTANLRLELSDGAGEVEVASRERLLAALKELVTNAIEAAPRGETVVNCGLGKKELLLEIRDGGPGVLESERAKLFQPFHTTRPNHLGVGLSVAKRAISEIGGRIELSPESAKGLTVGIVLPM